MTTIIFLNFLTWIHQSCSQIIWLKKMKILDWFLFTVRACGTYYIGYFIRSRNLNLNKWWKSSFKCQENLQFLISISWKNPFILTAQFFDFFACFLREEFFVIKFRRTNYSWRKCNLYSKYLALFALPLKRYGYRYSMSISWGCMHYIGK